MQKNTKLRLGAVAAVAAAGMAFGTLPAAADPVGYPPLIGVGSDTTQDVVAGLASVIPTLGSFDATGSQTIRTRSAVSVEFNRPNGSSQGVYALSSSANNGTFPVGTSGATANISGQVDFARSSSGPSAGSGLTYYPFAIDAVTYAVNVASTFPRDVALGYPNIVGVAPNQVNLDLPVNGVYPFTLRNIYAGRVTSFVDGGGEDQAITPLLPQSGSGTRSFWIGQLGLTEAGGASPTIATDRNGSVQEHNGNSITGPGDIVPFSIAQYIAQGNHAITPTTVIERRGNVALGAIGSRSPFTLAQTTPGTGPYILALNASFPVKRTVYNVVQTSRIAETQIAQTFVGPSSAVCQAAATIKAYGFAVHPTCGVGVSGAFRTTFPS